MRTCFQVGCSDVLPLVRTTATAVPPLAPSIVAVGTSSASPSAPRISGLSANLTSTGGLAVWVQMSEQPASAPCRLSVTVFAAGVLAAQERLNCSLPGTIINGVGPGPLQVSPRPPGRGVAGVHSRDDPLRDSAFLV